MWERRARRLRFASGPRTARGLRRLRSRREMGRGGRHLQDHRRRQDLQEADQRPADLASSAGSGSTISARTPTSCSRSSIARRSAWARRPRRSAPGQRLPRRVRRGCRAGREADASSSPDGPAAKAGLLAGDVVRRFDKKEIKTYEELQEADPGAQAPTTRSRLKIKRDDETKELPTDLVQTAGCRRRLRQEGRRLRVPAVPRRAGPITPTTAGKRRTSRTSRGPTASSTAASTNRATAANRGRASTASTPADVLQRRPRRSTGRQVRLCPRRQAVPVVATAARPSRPTPARASTTTAMPCGSTRATAGT